MILKEQFLKNKGRILWSGSKYKEWKASPFCCPYVSTQVLYALNFSKDFNKPIVEKEKLELKEKYRSHPVNYLKLYLKV